MKMSFVRKQELRLARKWRYKYSEICRQERVPVVKTKTGSDRSHIKKGEGIGWRRSVPVSILPGPAVLA